MKLAMQEVIDMYFNDDELLERVVSDYINNSPLIDNYLKDDSVYFQIDKYISPMYEIQKLYISFFKILFKERRILTESDYEYEEVEVEGEVYGLVYMLDMRVYELVFTDYDQLDLDDVAKLLTGFEDFLYGIRDMNTEDRIKEMECCYTDLRMNPNLPEDIYLWLMLK
jgi:hypothetical protein